jgi:hypothetical protein
MKEENMKLERNIKETEMVKKRGGETHKEGKEERVREQ